MTVGADHQMLFGHHQAIFEAIRDKDPERARKAMLTHLTFAEERSNEYVRLKKNIEG
jgi:GntR family transcriptional repressor for pyruvate dehydrogenase complex